MFKTIKNLSAALLITSGIAFSGSAWAADTYATDQGHTEVIFGWSHAGVSVQHGEFTEANGTLDLDTGNVENSKLNVVINTSSLASGYEALDKHLKSSDFLDVEKFPQATFESTSISKTSDTTADVTGNLTLHGVTKPVTLNVTLTHQGAHPGNR